MNGQTAGLSSLGGLVDMPPQPKSVFINQLDGGYTINLQGPKYLPVKVAVTVDEVAKIVTDYFNTVESVQTNESPSQINEVGVEASQGENLLA